MAVTQDRFSKSFLNDIIKKHVKDDIEIVNTNISSVVSPGENYTCELFRIVVTFLKKDRNNVRSMSMIAKSLIEHELVKKINEELGFFTCEFNIYNEVLPMMEKLEYKKTVAPKTYYLSKDSKNIIVIEDLSALNYKMANRQEGLDLEHCLLAIEKLAYFHASSLALYEKDPEVMNRYNKGVYYKTNLSDKFYSIAFQEILNVCKKEPSLQKYYEKITVDIKEKVYELSKRDLEFNVLNHGDFWCNNLMFQYNADGHLKDVLFVDFQFSVFASPFIDLHYFMATSTNVQVKEKHLNDILQYYYDVLVKNVNILRVKSKVPNWNDFKKDFCNKACIGLASMCITLPVTLANKVKDASVVNFIENGEEGSFRHQCFTNSKYISAVKLLLPFYDSLGVFNS